MKYEMIPKDILDDACISIQNIQSSVSKLNIGDIKRKEIMRELDTTYKAIQQNRCQCNVKPEGA